MAQAAPEPKAWPVAGALHDPLGGGLVPVFGTRDTDSVSRGDIRDGSVGRPQPLAVVARGPWACCPRTGRRGRKPGDFGVTVDGIGLGEAVLALDGDGRSADGLHGPALFQDGLEGSV